MNQPVYITALTIFDAYKQLLNYFGQYNLRTYHSTTAIVVISDSTKHELPSKIEGSIDDYYQIFISNQIDERWENDKDWYLSYARRLYLKCNDISQLDIAVECLSINKDSRRCVLNTYDSTTDSPFYRPALTSIWFGIEDNKLNMHALWRSNELSVSFPIKILAMFSFMRLMYSRLLRVYPTLQLGGYIEFINSLHVYSSNTFKEYRQLEEWQLFQRFCNNYSEEQIRYLWGIVLSDKEEDYDRTKLSMAM